MRRKLFSIIIGIFLLFLLTPGVLLAQSEKLNDCCKVRTNFEIFGKKFQKNCIIGAKHGFCIIDGVDESAKLALDSNELTGLTCGGATKEVKWFEKWGMICLLNSIYRITNWLFYLLMVAVVLMVIYGGFLYLTSAGNPDKTGKGRRILMFAIAGLAVAMLAKFVPSIVKVVIGMGGSTTQPGGD